MIYVILGPSGCGKGTQAKLLGQKFGLPVISSGEFLRRRAEQGDPLALQAKVYADRGDWPPFGIITRLIESELESIDFKKGFVLDGTPRTIEQAPWLDEFLKAHQAEVSKAIHLETSLSQSHKRIEARVLEDTLRGHARSDESEDAINERFESYLETIQPIKEYYESQGKLVLVNNEQSISGVHGEICHKLGL